MDNARKYLLDFVIITVGIIIAAAGIFLFMMPSNLAISSMSGLAVLLGKVIPIKVSTILLSLNIATLVLSIIFVGKEFTIKTLYPSLCVPLCIKFYEYLLPNYTVSIMGDQFADMVCYVFMVNLGISMMFMRNASSGGLDIIAKILNKYFHIEVGTSLSICGLCIAVPSLMIFDVKTGVLSILGTYVSGIVLDHYIFGFGLKKKVCIIASSQEMQEKIVRYILDDMHSGATLYQSVGAYTMENRTEINAIVNKQEYAQLVNYIQKTDTGATVTVYNVTDTHIRPKRYK